MSAIRLLLQAEAAQQCSAVRATGYRHLHLAKKPLIVCVYNLSGEAAAPLGIAYGTSPRSMKVVSSAEPRNRESRFAAINQFASDFHAYVSAHLVTRTEVLPSRGHGPVEREVAVSAPQIVVPNRSTQDFLGSRLGRYLRYLNFSTTAEVPEETLWTGAHLSWLEDHSHYPGQSIFLSATEALSRHFCTGQSSYEDENLSSLLAWIQNPAGGDAKPLSEAEQKAPMGPVPDPRWEAQLEPLVRSYSEALSTGDESDLERTETLMRKRVTPPLRDAVIATHKALSILSKIPQAGSVSDRWETDVGAWSAYCRRAQKGIPRFSVRHSPLTAARKLETWSKALEKLEAQEAFDDPMVMAEFVAQGQSISGQVAAIDVTNREVKPGNVKATQVPLIRCRLATRTRLLPGTDVVWTEDRRVKAEIRSVPDPGEVGDCLLAVIAGHKGGERLPKLRGTAVFVTIIPFDGRAPDGPIEVPWTHKLQADGSSDKALQAAGDDSLAAGAESDGSPDLQPDDVLGSLPVGVVSPGDVPGVVL